MSKLKLAGAGFLVASLMMSTSVFAQEDIGVASMIKNEVQMKNPGADDFEVVSIKDKIYMLSEVTSGDDAKMQILFKDESMFTVGSNSEMVINEFVYNPSSGSGKMTASIKRGAFRFMSGRVAKDPNAVKINTPSASMGVRGTLFEGVVGANASSIAKASGVIPADADIEESGDSTLIVLRGPGRGNRGSDRRGEVDVSTDTMTVTLDESNSAAFVTADGNDIFGPFPLSTEALELFDEVLRTEPATGAPSKSVVSIETIAGAVEEAAPVQERGPDDVDPADVGENNGAPEERPDTQDEGAPVEPDLPGGPSCNPSPDGVCQG